MEVYQYRPEELEMSMQIDDVVPDETWEPVMEFVVTPEMNRYFMECLDDHQPWWTGDSPYGGPIAAPGVLHEMAFLAMLRRFPVSPPPGGVSVHAKQESEFHYPANVGAKVTIEVRLSQKYVKRDKDYILHEARCVDEEGRLLLISRHHRMVGRRE